MPHTHVNNVKHRRIHSFTVVYCPIAGITPFNNVAPGKASVITMDKLRKKLEMRKGKSL